MTDRYGPDVLAGDWRAARAPKVTDQPADPGVVVEDVQTGWVGAIVGVEKSGGMYVVHLEDRRGKVKAFPLGPGFHVDGRPVRLTPPSKRAEEATAHRAATAKTRTASGSVAVTTKARVARGSRIWVEGKHDAELVEKVWGDDLRVEGVVVEMLNGVDDLVGAIEDFSPDRQHRLGILVDHLVPGSKESRIVEQVRAIPAYRECVHVLGHPYVDVWQSVRPDRLGLSAWPVIERGRSWKESVLQALGWPHRTQIDVAQGWRRILASVHSYADLEPTLLASVEELIDFVTVD